MMEIFDLENVYDEQISPLMQKIIAICQENNMPMIASFAFENCEERNLGCCTTILNDYEFRILYDAPPAPAVPDKPRLPPHVYRDPLDMLQETAIAYGGTQQLRAQLSSALSIHVQPDHPHTRAAMLAQPVSSGYKLPDGWKLVPVEPTAEMINAALASGALSIRTVYRAMLAAAPEGGNDHD
ncbi:TPA: hypothetical protein KEY88_001161 [Serratia marcescens]|nr:hypothetical protein [Serratia marcescens]